MSDLLALALAGTLLAGLMALGWWLLVATEGVYLGRRVVIWLYDRFAPRYDGVKHYIHEYEQMYLAQPIMEQIAPHRSPLVLDVAAGTGRLPLALLRHTHFQGHVVALDLSRAMLRQGARNPRFPPGRVTWVWASAEKLPFPDDTFDVVTCLEALEFMTRPAAVLRELARVLRPGGLLLITQRINTRLMPGKTWSSGEMLDLLAACGIEAAHAQIWQVDYRKVWGRKTGDSPAAGARPPEECLRCPRCGAVAFARAPGALVCENCGACARLPDDSVIELYPLERRG